MKSQSGFLLIAAIVLIVIVALVAIAMLTLTAGSGQAGGSQLGATQALFAAESGVERALRGLSREGTTCANLTYNGTLVVGSGSATFATTGTVNAPTSTSLSAGINATTAVIPVASVTNYASHGRITIGAETIQYQSTSTSAAACGTAPCFLGAVRGVGGTPAATHNAADVVRQLQCTIRSTGTSGGAQRVVERAATISGGTNAMMAYAKDSPAGSVGTPFYRIWDSATSAWGVEQTANSVGAGRVIQYVLLKSARTRNEVILGTQDSTGDIRVQVWNGTAWGATTLIASITNTYDDFRGFDIEYETNGDRAVIAYQTTTANQFSYRIWNGTAWSAATNIALPAVGVPQWIELAPNPEPASNELALMTLTSTANVYGMSWNGAAWGNMGVAASWGTATIATRRPMNVAYEQRASPARALFVWGSSGTIHSYRIWNGTTLAATATFSIPAMGGVSNWVRLAASPFSNQIMFGVQDASRDLNTALWNGAGVWTVHAEHDGGLENAASRNFDVVFDASPGRAGDAWLVWGTRSGSDFVRRRQYTAGAWGAITNFGDDVALTHLAAHPNSGWLFGGLYGDSTGTARNLTEIHYNGAWTQTTVWAGPVIADPVQQRVFITPMVFGTGVSVYDWVEVLP